MSEGGVGGIEASRWSQEELVRLVRAGEPVAWAELHDRFGLRLRTAIERRLALRTARGFGVEDVVNAGFEKLLSTRLAGFGWKGPDSLGRWLVSVVLNVGRDMQRMEQARLREVLRKSESVSELLRNAREKTACQPEAEASFRECEARVHELLARLPERDVHYFHLYCEGVPIQEIAALDGVSPDTVSRKVKKVRLFLSRRLGEERGAEDGEDGGA